MAQISMGYRPGSLSRGNGEATTGWSRLTYLGKTTQPLWVRRGGVRMGRNQSGTAWAAPVLYSGPTSGAPVTLVARTNTLALTTYMNGGDRAGGANMEAAVQTPVLIPAGTHLFGGFWVSSGNIGYGQDLSGAMMYKTVPPKGNGGSPNATWNQSSQANEGNIDTWWVFDTNATPSAPTILTPANGSATSDVSPDITIQFVDPNAGDSVSKWLIELYDAANSTRLYTSGVVSAPTGVSGSTITWNPGDIQTRSYTGRAYTWDQGGAKSAARTWTFTVNAGGTVTNLTLAAGVGVAATGETVYNDTTPNSVTATWTHQSGENADAWKVRLVNADTAAVVRAETSISSVPTAPGDTITIPWPVGWADLPRGATRYAWEVQATDALGGVSGWVRSPVFIVNAAPAITSAVPADTFSQTTRPELAVTVSDATDAAATLGAVFDVGGVARAGTYRAPDTLVYQTTAADLAAPTIALTWNVTVTDPWGLSTTLGARTVNYVTPPSVTITSPVGTITVGAPAITATVDRTVATYRARITVAGTDITVLDTDTVAGSGTAISEPVPAGLLRNLTDYLLTLDGQTSDGLTFSVTQAFRVEYEASPFLADVSLTLMPSSVFDQGDHAQFPNALIAWGRLDEADISETDWIGYIVRRYDGDGSGREWLIRNRDVTAMTDRSAGHGTHDWYVGYRHYVNAGADVIDSQLAKVSADIAIRHTTITHDDSDLAVTFKYWRDRRVEQQIAAEALVPLGRSKPYGFQAETNYDTIRGSFQPLSASDSLYSARQIVEAARDLAAPVIGADGTPQPQPEWYRDPLGRVMRVMWSRGVRADDAHRSDRGEIDVELTEVDAPEIVPLVQPIAAIDMTGVIDLAMPGPMRWDELKVYRGDSLSRRYAFRFGDGTLLDTTGWTARMWISTNRDDAVPVLSSDNGDITLTTGIGGTAPNQWCLAVDMTEAQTLALPVGFAGWYDIELTNLSNQSRTYVYGVWRAEGAVVP